MKQLEKRIDDYFDGYWRYGLESNNEIIDFAYNELVAIPARDKRETYFGASETIRQHYILITNVKKTDLNYYHKKNGQWKPGRMVIKSAPDNYHVWVRYDRGLNDTSKNKMIASFGKPESSAKDRWILLPEKDSQIIHCDIESEMAPKIENKMDGVSTKLAKYFGEYEMGVYQEAVSDNDRGAVWAVDPIENTTAYLKAMNAQGKHIFIRPTFDKEPHFMMCDDLDQKQLDTQHKIEGKWKPGRLVVESSPGNYQVWIKSDRPLSVEEKKHWLQKMNSDPGASPLHRWGRAPGFRNRKSKYQTKKGYPLSRLVWVDWKNRAKIPRVEIVPEIDKDGSKSKAFKGVNRQFSGSSLPFRVSYDKGDESATDFAYALALLRRGVNRCEVEQRIKDERTNWDNHKGESRIHAYLKKTLDRAEAVIDNGRYEITVKDTKRNREKRFSVSGIAGSNVKEDLKDKARSAVAQMGYKNTDNLDVSIRRVKEKPAHDLKIVMRQ